jgi:hypothetical protein
MELSLLWTDAKQLMYKLLMRATGMKYICRVKPWDLSLSNRGFSRKNKEVVGVVVAVVVVVESPSDAFILNQGLEESGQRIL